MSKYVLVCILSVAFSFVLEKVADGGFEGKGLNLRSKIHGKRFVVLLLLNAAAWVSCLYLNFSDLPLVLILCIGFDILLGIALSDYYTQTIPNGYLLALFALAVVCTVYDTACPWYGHLLGCGLGGLSLLLLRLLGKKLLKQEALGSGDVYLSGSIGLFLGLEKYLLCGLTASVLALITIRVLRRKKQYDKMHRYPLSPFFAVGYAVAAIFGNLLLERYYALFLSSGLL